MAPGPRRSPPRALLAGLLLTAAGLCGGPAVAQQHAHGAGPGEWSGALGGQAVPLVTHAAPALHGESATEFYLTQPAVWGHLASPAGRLRLLGMLNLEGLTLRRGELNAGVYGEGYIDRRHPHTYLHELMLVVRALAGPARDVELTLAAGKGFAPFGTDDPMTRPLVKYPVNHHLAQVLERLVGIAALRAGPAVVEAGVFSGDEPADPASFATPGRFGDSWAARLTLLPAAGLEVQGSFADVASPEFPAGSGLDHHKWSASARWQQGDASSGRYALLEWARTDERSAGRTAFRFHSLLAEGALRRHGVEAALRLERTTRPEEERLSNPFRSSRPHTDVHLLGITRWSVATVALASELGAVGALRARPFVEVGYARPDEITGSPVFEPAHLYGSTRLWSFSAGARVELGAGHARMGRYGAALAEPPR